MAPPLAFALGGAALGGLGGIFGRPRQVRSPFEQQALQGMSGTLGSFQSLIGAGPGVEDVAAGVGATRDFATLLGNLQASGGLPGQADISAGRNFASRLFAAREEQLSQSFEDQLRQANRAAAASGRSVNDPILRARLAQEQTRQQRSLQAERMGAEAQYAEGALGRRVEFGGQRAQTLMGLGNQALANQQNLFSMQQGLFNTAAQTRRTEQSGFGALLQGALGGAGAGMQLASLFGGSGGGAPASQSFGSALGQGFGQGLSSNLQFNPRQYWGASSPQSSGPGPSYDPASFVGPTQMSPFMGPLRGQPRAPQGNFNFGFSGWKAGM